MLLRSLLLLVVALAFASVETGAADENSKKKRETDVALHPPCTINCKAASKELFFCLKERNGTKYHETFVKYEISHDYERLNKLVEKLIEKKCIREEYADAIRCLLTLIKKPDFWIEFYANLTKKEKTAMYKNILYPDNEEYQKAAKQVNDKIDERRESMTEDEKSEDNQWWTDYLDGCGY